MSGDADGFDSVMFLERVVPVASNDNMGEMRDPLAETLEAEDVDSAMGNAGSTVAPKGVAEPATHLAFNTHIDAVLPHASYDRDEDIIHGRGPCGAKGPLAVLLSVFFATDPDPDTRVTPAITPDEELLSTGVTQLDLDGDRHTVGGPTGLGVYMVTEGRFEGMMSLSGVAAHAAEPRSDVSVVDALAPVLDALRSFGDDYEAHSDLGPATLTPMMVDSGANSNQVPADCRLMVDRRSVPSKTAKGLRGGLESMLRAAVPDDIGVDSALMGHPTPLLEAFAIDPDHELVTPLTAASRNADGRADVRPFTAVTEVSYFSSVSVVVFGPGDLADDEGAVAHVDREYVRTDGARTTVAALRATIAALTA